MEEGGRPTAARRRSRGGSVAQSGEEARERKAALQAALRKKSECEAKALHIVERLLEINVTEEFLLDCIKFITAAHYQDVVEERSIIKQCGYPVCQNTLGIVPKQQYKISTKTNRVYDITERKHFCSNFCYKASKYLEAQIPKDPLWLREQERAPACQLLKEQRGSAGEEVRFQTSNIQVLDVDNPPFMDDRHVSSSSSSESDSSGSDQEFVSTILMGEKYNLKSAGHKQFKKKQQVMSTKSGKTVPVPKSTEIDHEVENVAQQLKEYHVNNAETSSSRLSQNAGSNPLTFALKEETPQAADQDVPQTTSSTGLKDDEKLVTSNVTTQGLSKKGAASLKKLIATSKQCNLDGSGRSGSGRSTSGVERNVLKLLRQTLSEWNTEETSRFLYGSNLKCKRTQCSLPRQSSHATEEEQLDEDDLDSLEVIEIIDPNENVSKSVHVDRSEANVRPLPNFEQLKQESELLHLKVKEFYKGRYVLPDNTENNCEENYQSATSESREKNPVLPLVDSEAQHQIRKRIVLDALKKVLPKLLVPFQLSMSDIFSELNSLVKTFRLTNKNIIHRTPEWTLIAVVLLSVLAVKISQLQESLQRLTSELFVSTILKEFHIQIEELENLKNIFQMP
ncbi:putative RNA polymerase II subunit B1 CTD phosphatase rpap2 [Pristis pectinata]|uniref:putative RNA polymerase II subunit B1 CTD phosphatase rpap2 n=1 Tax=Pristis pectinata TaxID=685728 RepID=UPI00223DD986|nr:putative RNA polymerase II subunit B1 CTD phosphatase rpap2 [Pristis pectinata]